MPVPERLARIAGGGRADLLAALGLSSFLLIALAADGLLHGAGNLLEAATGVGVFCCLIPRRAYPRLAAVAAAVFFALSALGPMDAIPNGLGNLVAVPVFLLSYSLGAAPDQRRSLPALLALLIGLQVGNGLTTFNPIFLVLTIGPWAIGLVVRSRRQLTEQLAVRGRELEADALLHHLVGRQRIDGRAQFDGAYSNLGALNCVPNLTEMAEQCARRREGMTMKLLMTILLAACVTGCLGNGGNIPHEDSEGATPHNEGAPLCHDGTPPPCVIRN